MAGKVGQIEAGAATSGSVWQPPMSFAAALTQLKLQVDPSGTWIGDFWEDMPRQLFIARVQDGVVTNEPIGPADKSLSWPVMATTGKYFALKDGALARLDGGQWNVLAATSGVKLRRLIGVVGNTAYGVGADGAGDPRIVAVSLDNGARAVIADEPHLQGYSDGAQRENQDRLRVERSERGGRGYDVFLWTSSGLRNITNGGDKCAGHVSFSPKGDILYLQTNRY